MTAFAAIHPSRSASASSASGTAAVIALAAAALWVLATALIASSAAPGERAQRVVLAALVIGVPVASGLYAIRSAQTARFGILLIGIGVVWSLSALAESASSLPYSVGRVVAWLIFPLLIYAMLAFPDGRVADGVDRTLFGGTALLIAVLFIGSSPFIEAFPAQTPWSSCGEDCPANAFFVLDSEPAVMDAVVQPVRELAAILLLLGVTASLGHKMRAATRLARRMIGPVLMMSIVSAVTLIAYLLTRRLAGDSAAVDKLGVAWSLTVPGIAAAFSIGLFSRRLLMGGVLARLSSALGRDAGRESLRNAVATALGDPSIEILIADGRTGGWCDPRGRRASPPAIAGSDHAVMTVSDGDGPLAVLVHDPALCSDEELLAAVASQVRSALRHDRLTDRLAASLSELEASRKRIATASDLERSRIERDLHDGAQQRLVTLRIRLSLAEELLQTNRAAVGVTLAELGREIDDAIDELRALTHGIYPPILTDRGLEDALRSVAIDSPLPIRVRAVGLGRHSAEIETAVYFTCLEALQNVHKHARQATHVWVTLRQGRALSFEIGDDGPGFAPAHDRTGGLRHMRDRIEAIGGRLTIDSSPEHGTRIRGSVPLEGSGARAA